MQPSSDLIEALYFHIPFCRKICPFCAFAVRKNRADLHHDYLKSMLDEFCKRVDQFSAKLGKFQVIYIGGGTPSSLELEEVAFLLQAIQQQIDGSETIEISFEVNPEDATPEYIAGLKELGITRLSVGVQSFQKESLEALQRNHTIGHSIQAVSALQEVAISNFNLDIMFGIPEQSLATFQRDLQAFLEKNPPHLSLYALDIEPNTPFAHQAKKRRWIEHNRELIQAMYLWAVDTMHSHGIIQYEVSNFAKPAQKSLSNLMVWSGKPYLGLGIGAHSYVQGMRWGNHSSFRSYQTALQKKEWPVAFQEKLSWLDQANERLMLGLRQTSGFSINDWERWGFAWPQQNNEWLETWEALGYLSWNPPIVSLQPKGMLLADEITQRLMLP